MKPEGFNWGLANHTLILNTFVPDPKSALPKYVHQTFK